MKDISIKKIVLSCIALVIEIITLIYVGISASCWQPIKFYLGYVYAILLITLSIVGISLISLGLFLFPSDKCKKINKVFVLCNFVFSIISMVASFVLGAFHLKRFIELDYVQFILIIICTISYFICNGTINEVSLIKGNQVIGNSSEPKTTIKQAESSIELLLEYKKLLDQGVITQEEFDAKKKELL
ncbi:MAG: SHOCT domain-containing protein [Ruminococcus flavefaciens]|nr:SHOCT domain-containing protein [Ruminococcus flavefaciens]